MAESITWRTDLEGAIAEAKSSGKLVLLDFSAAPMWAGCARLDAEVYASPTLAALIDDYFLPVRVHVKQKDEFARLGEKYGAQWTPTTLLIDGAGVERHRIEGFLPLDDFASQLMLGRAHASRMSGDFTEAESRYKLVIERYPLTEAAAEAQYWAGVSRYKATDDFHALIETSQAFEARYQESPWAKKASVWKQK